ncbi:nucleotide sugar dehydrogenase [Romboutsia lituseburensis]|uniref:UDP-N-acetyl-D-galactosamine dehydrogenase n=1 Tax=Romboutsia lituseburensis DSM 797 TaxID=1121325 RepID=A0A1G9IVF8_9FIRM|nr:nucleotide sugar dehydrogenase [Romboutsia lituseburensis]CEH33753.1 Protein CapL [Romboutsia lituseburensis]SDL28794.1 UDP-N-acetyl-D-galactosamine dehydrogenase [Romboutsia lituseburensis DSM 797]
MNLYESIKSNKEKISVIGLGYVGIPLAVEFSKHCDVIGFDINKEKINQYLNGIDPTQEVGDENLKDCKVLFTSDEENLKKAKFHIVAVPTPINQDKTPNLKPIIGASEVVARNLTKGSIVVYESTVYPGTTEEICVPILEKISGLKYKRDFKIGYSPERINPGDKVNRLTSIVKIVSGCDEETLDTVAKVYEMIIQVGVYRAESIKVAEAAKVIENSQRDINIAFMNELAMVFDKMNIDTVEVLKAARTKWNFLNFKPGLVGGHCIGVDPYYFIYKAQELGYHSQIILSGRQINDEMGKYIGQNTIKKLVLADKKVKGAKVGIMGITFKENCPDIRNTKVIDIINELREYGVDVLVYDPIANKDDVKSEYNIDLVSYENLQKLDAVLIAVEHEEFKKLDIKDIKNMQNKKNPIIIDIKGIFDKDKITGCMYYRL